MRCAGAHTCVPAVLRAGCCLSATAGDGCPLSKVAHNKIEIQTEEFGVRFG